MYISTQLVLATNAVLDAIWHQIMGVLKAVSATATVYEIRLGLRSTEAYES